jgi:hypothetical protein
VRRNRVHVVSRAAIASLGCRAGPATRARLAPPEKWAIRWSSADDKMCMNAAPLTRVRARCTGYPWLDILSYIKGLEKLATLVTSSCMRGYAECRAPIRQDSSISSQSRQVETTQGKDLAQGCGSAYVAQNERGCHQRQCSSSTHVFRLLREAMKHPKGRCHNPLIPLIGWHIASGTAGGTRK